MGVWLAGSMPYPPGFMTGIEIPLPPDLTLSSATVREERLASGNASNWYTEAGFRGSFNGCGLDRHRRLRRRLHKRDPGLASHPRPPRSSKFWPRSVISGYGLDDMPGVCRRGDRCNRYRLDGQRYLPARVHRGISGSLLDSRATTAVRDLRFSVSDRGSGVRSAALEIDGQLVQTSQLGDAACAPPYGRFAPCPSTASGRFSVDTSTFGPGPH